MEFPVQNISDLESLSYAVKWQYFEKLVAWIFEQNDFSARQNVVMKLPGWKRQFDVIAEKDNIIFLVECKKWTMKQRASALGVAGKKHLERCELFALNYNETGKKIIPLIVTLVDDDVMESSGIPVVPILKLNSFLNEEL